MSTDPRPPRPEPTPDPQPWPDPDDLPEPDEDPEERPEDLEDVLSSLARYQLPSGVPPQLIHLINFDAELPIEPGTRLASLCYRRPKPWWSDGSRGSTFAWPVWAALIHHPTVEIWLQGLAGSLGADDEEPSLRLVVDFSRHHLYILGAEEAARLLKLQHPPVHLNSSSVDWGDPLVQKSIRAVIESLYLRDRLRSRRRRLPGALGSLLSEEERLILEMTAWLDHRLHALVIEGCVHSSWLQLLQRRAGT